MGNAFGTKSTHNAFFLQTGFPYGILEIFLMLFKKMIAMQMRTIAP